MGTYTLSDAARILSVSPARLRYWERTKLMPARRDRDAPNGFDFRDLVSARAVLALLDRGVSLRRIRSSVEALRNGLPDVEEPLSALQVWSETSGRMVVEHPDGLIEPEGQMLLDFRGDETPSTEVLRLPTEEGEVPRTAIAWFKRGCELDGEPLSYADAMEAYENALALDPGLADAHCNLGAVLYNRGRRPQARACFARCLELAPGHLEAHFNLGNLLEEEGLEDEALAHYQAAYQTDPLHPDLQVNLALLYEKLGQLDDALAAWRRYLQIHPDGPWAEVARQRLLRDES